MPSQPRNTRRLVAFVTAAFAVFAAVRMLWWEDQVDQGHSSSSGSAPLREEDARVKQRAHKRRQRRRKKMRNRFQDDGTLEKLLLGDSGSDHKVGADALHDGTGVLSTLPPGHHQFDLVARVRSLHLNWKNCPPPVDPGYRFEMTGRSRGVGSRWESSPTGGLAPARAARKRQQIESIAGALRAVVDAFARGDSKPDRRLRVVDFGSGSGNIGLALAWLFPSIDFVLVDIRPMSIKLVKDRARAACLENVTAVVADAIGYNPGSFDVGIAVHACGALTDHAQMRCIASRAEAYILCPCCIGKIKGEMLSSKPGSPRVERPRSTWMRKSVTLDQYKRLATAADYHGFEGSETKERAPPHIRFRRLCKAALECDRNEAGRENGFVPYICKLVPPNCSTKNDVLIGLKPRLARCLRSEN